MFVPEDAFNVMRFDVVEKRGELVGVRLPIGRMKWHGACLSRSLLKYGYQPSP